MFTPTVYSTQPAGSRRRILSTETTAAGSTTRTVVTLDDALATQAALHLGDLITYRHQYLSALAADAPGQVCYARRNLMAAVLTGPVPLTAAIVAGLAELAAGLPDAERRAIADEVGRVFDGTQGILVPVALEGENGHANFLCLANGWLETASDVDVLDAADPNGDFDVLYGDLLMHLRDVDPLVEEACIAEALDVTINRTAAAAWLRRHRPHLGDQLDELLASV